MRYVSLGAWSETRSKRQLYISIRILGALLRCTLCARAGVADRISRLARLLDQSGIEFRTLVPTKAAVIIYVVDLKRDMRAKITAAARKLKARVTSRRGSAGFIGDDSSQ